MPCNEIKSMQRRDLYQGIQVVVGLAFIAFSIMYVIKRYTEEGDKNINSNNNNNNNIINNNNNINNNNTILIARTNSITEKAINSLINNIYCSGLVDFTITIGDERKIKLQVDDNFKHFLKYDLDTNQTISITYGGYTGNTMPNVQCDLYLQPDDIHSMQLINSVKATLKKHQLQKDFQAESLDWKVNNSAQLTIEKACNITCNALIMHASNSATITMNDNAFEKITNLTADVNNSASIQFFPQPLVIIQKQTITVNGSGDYKGEKLKSNYTNIIASKCGTAAVQCSDIASGSSATSAHINVYSNDTQKLQKNIIADKKSSGQVNYYRLKD